MDTLIALSCVTRPCVRAPWERAVQAAQQRRSTDFQSGWSALASSLLDASARSRDAPSLSLLATPRQFLGRSPGITPSSCAVGGKFELAPGSPASGSNSCCSEVSAYSAESWRCIRGGDNTHTGLTPMLDELTLTSPPAQLKAAGGAVGPVPYSAWMSPSTAAASARHDAVAPAGAAPLREGANFKAPCHSAVYATVGSVLVAVLASVLAGSKLLLPLPTEELQCVPQGMLTCEIAGGALSALLEEQQHRSIVAETTQTAATEMSDSLYSATHGDMVSVQPGMEGLRANTGHEPTPETTFATCQWWDEPEYHADAEASAETGGAVTLVTTVETSPESHQGGIMVSARNEQLFLMVDSETTAHSTDRRNASWSHDMQRHETVSASFAGDLVHVSRRSRAPARPPSGIQLSPRSERRLVWKPRTPRCPAKCGLAPNNLSRALAGMTQQDYFGGATDMLSTSNVTAVRLLVPAPLVAAISDLFKTLDRGLIKTTGPVRSDGLLALPLGMLPTPPAAPASHAWTQFYVGSRFHRRALQSPTNALSASVQLMPPAEAVPRQSADVAPALSPTREGAPSLALVRSGHWVLLLRSARGCYTQATSINIRFVGYTWPANAVAVAFRATVEVGVLQSLGSAHGSTVSSGPSSSVLVGAARRDGRALMVVHVPMLVPHPIPSAGRLLGDSQRDDAEDVAENLYGLFWKKFVQAAACAFVAHRRSVQMAMVVGTLMSLLALGLLQMLNVAGVERAPKGRAVGTRASKSATTVPEQPQSSPERPASAILRLISLGTPAAAARADPDADLIEQSGVSALRALAGRTPVRIGSSMASILRDFAQATPTSVDSQAGGCGEPQ